MPPIDEDDKIEDAGPSPDVKTTLDEGAAEAAAEGSQSSGEQKAQPEDTLSIIRDVAEKSEERAAQEGSPPEGEKDGPETGDKAPKEPDDEAFSDVPFHKHPRFQQLLHQRNQYKNGAEQYQNVQRFLDENTLTAEEAADGLVLMALMKTNPVEAWKQLRPHVERVLHHAGEIIPDDLQKRVDAGEMARETALEVSRLRARNNTAEFQRQFDQYRAEQKQTTTLQNSLQTAATDWERDRYTKDPKFAEKQQALQKEVLYLLTTEGKPNTPEGVKAQLDKAYKAVNAALPRPAPVPQRRAVRPVTGGQVSGNTRPDPTSTLEVIRANRAGAQ